MKCPICGKETKSVIFSSVVALFVPQFMCTTCLSLTLLMLEDFADALDRQQENYHGL